MASRSAIIVWLSLMRFENRFRAAEGGTGTIALTLELKSLARVKAVVIEWQAAAKSFEVQVASDAGPWSVFASALLIWNYARNARCVFAMTHSISTRLMGACAQVRRRQRLDEDYSYWRVGAREESACNHE